MKINAFCYARPVATFRDDASGPRDCKAASSPIF